MILHGEWKDIPHIRVGSRKDRYFSIPEVMEYLEKKFNSNQPGL